MALSDTMNDIKTEDLPLTKAQSQRLIINTDRLIMTMSLQDGLLSELRNNDVLNDYHERRIRSLTGEVDKTEKLLEIMKRRSRIQFGKFIQCLCRTGQRHITYLLAEGTTGGIAFDHGS